MDCTVFKSEETEHVYKHKNKIPQKKTWGGTDITITKNLCLVT